MPGMIERRHIAGIYNCILGRQQACAGMDSKDLQAMRKRVMMEERYTIDDFKETKAV